jgi:hypothetical protein
MLLFLALLAALEVLGKANTSTTHVVAHVACIVGGGTDHKKWSAPKHLAGH